MKPEELKRVKERVDNAKSTKNGRISFNLEYGRGATYSNGNPTLYAYDSYPRSSVLSGRERRRWIYEFDSWEDAREGVKAAKLKIDVPEPDSVGSGYVETELPAEPPGWFDPMAAGESWGEDY